MDHDSTLIGLANDHYIWYPLDKQYSPMADG